MQKAKDAEGIDWIAEEAEKDRKYYCRICDNPVLLRKGNIRVPHFAHIRDCKCPFEDKDNMSEWHRRMQNHFPIKSREYIFVDDKTGERHIADVFDEDKNTVIEFQHSSISSEEFYKRTLYHLSNNRRIVWVFDESTEERKGNDLGKLRPLSSNSYAFPYKYYTFKWLYNRRAFLRELPYISIYKCFTDFSVCIYPGDEGDDYVHRIIGEDDDFGQVTISVKNILIKEEMDIDDFFRNEKYWFEQEDWVNIMNDLEYHFRIMLYYDKCKDDCRIYDLMQDSSDVGTTIKALLESK